MLLPSDFSPEERRQRAQALFRSGYNCCQSVVLAFKDILQTNNLASESVLSIVGSGFGGGMARMREVCGSFSGAVMMAGFISPATNPDIKTERTTNYALVQDMAEEFRFLNGGSIVCRELLGISPIHKEGPEPSDRNPDFYKKRPCEQIIGNSAFIVAERLLNSNK